MIRPAIFTNISSECQMLLGRPRRRRKRAAISGLKRATEMRMVSGDHDSAFGQRFLDVAQAAGEPQIEPDRVLHGGLWGPEAV
jgi:hypothetical protein